MACGKRNPRGFQLDLFLVDGRVETRWVVPEHAVGWPGLAHGGALSTLLDEVMTWVAIATTGRYHVTGEMTVRFLAPAAPGEELTVRGEVAEDRRRYLVCRGGILGPGGPVARAEGRFFPVSAERQAELEEQWRREAAAHALPGPDPPA